MSLNTALPMNQKELPAKHEKTQKRKSSEEVDQQTDGLHFFEGQKLSPFRVFSRISRAVFFSFVVGSY